MKAQITYFELDGRFIKAMKALGQCLHISTAEQNELMNIAEKTNEILSPVILKVDKRLGFDLALVLPEVTKVSPFRLIATCWVRHAENQTLHCIEINNINYENRDNLTDRYIEQITKMFQHIKNTKTGHFLEKFSFSTQFTHSGAPQLAKVKLSTDLNEKIDYQIKKSVGRETFDLEFPRPLLFRVGKGYHDIPYATVLPCRVKLSFTDGKPKLEPVDEDYDGAFCVYNNINGIPEDLVKQNGEIIASSQSITLISKDVNLLAMGKLWKEYLGDNLAEALSVAKHEARKKFKKYLHQYSLDLSVKADEAHAGTLYNWLIAKDDASIRALRTQALESFPALLPCIMKPGSVCKYEPTKIYNRLNKPVFFVTEETEASRLEIFNAIDNSEPLTPLILKVFNIPPSVLNMIHSHEAFSVGYTKNSSETRALLAYLGSFIPQGHWPQENNNSEGPNISDQWENFTSTIWALHYLTSSEDILIPCSLEEALIRELPWWKKKNPGNYIHEMKYEIHDMKSDFVNKILFPITIDFLRTQDIMKPDYEVLEMLLNHPIGPDRYSTMAYLVGRERTYLKLMELSNRWHKDTAYIESKVIQKGDVRSWVALFSPMSINGFTATCLTSSVELSQEGLAMDHCVGSYVSRCQQGYSHIVGLTDHEGRVSTIELNIYSPIANLDETPRYEVSLYQNKGVHNEEPSSQAIQAGQDLVNLLNVNQSLMNIQAIEEAANLRKAKLELDDEDIFIERMTDNIGYNPFSQEGRDCAIEAFQFLLPKSERGLSYQQWCDEIGIMEMLESAFEYQKKFTPTTRNPYR